MRTRIVELVALVALLGLLVLLASSSTEQPGSNHSTYDTGPNGYRALYGVLAREGIPLTRLELPLGQRDPQIRVLALTTAGYDRSDVRRLQLFMRHGGAVLAFAQIDGLHATRTFNAKKYANLALQKNPRAALGVYDAVVGKGLVAFDERPYGYDRTRSLWSVLPAAVHAAVWVALLAVILALIESNVRFVPPILREPPADRDSSDYLRSMAALLRRGRAGRTTIERFARAYPRSNELLELAAITRPNDAQVLRAAVLYAALRKEHA
ncbi:MAG: DUF4350 domain-containing protein [Candidatus Aquilonibacter sp.]